MGVVINAATAVTKTVRIVALHGRGGSGPVFRKKMEPLINMLPQSSLASSYQIEWHFPNAPHIHDSPSTTTSSIPPSTSTSSTSLSNNQKQSPQKYEWWSLPPNTRSFNATEYYGVDESIKLIENLQPHILIGHSQGAMLSSIIVAKAIKYMSSTSASTTSSTISTHGEVVSKMFLPKLAILSCPAYPQPYTHLLRGVNTCSSAIKNLDSNCMKIDSVSNRESTTGTPTTASITLLHVLSKQDKTNPYESGLQVAQSFQHCSRVSSNTIMTHEQGHKLCTDESFLQVYTDLIMKAASEVS